jgi:hypothetical protein
MVHHDEANHHQREEDLASEIQSEPHKADCYYLYSLRPILPFTNTDISIHILVLDTFVFVKGNMDSIYSGAPS